MLPVCGCLLVLRPPNIYSSIHNAIRDLTFFLHKLMYMIKVCVYSLTTPPSFFETTTSTKNHTKSTDLIGSRHSGLYVLSGIVVT